MKKNYWFPALLIALMAVLVFFEPAYGWRIRSFFARRNAQESDTSNLRIEKENLQAQLAKLQNIQAELPKKPANFIRAMVYSRYPLNFKNEFLVDIGKNEGVVQGAAVVFGGLLIGKIEEVFDDTALVLSVFDSRFEVPVRVGSAGVDALLEGGSLPRATLIPLKAGIVAGDIVYSASADFPYALPIATIGDMTISADQLFRQAALNFAYDINGIQTVFVAKK